MNKVVLDTNVFIYAIDNSSEHHQYASRILADNKIELYTTSKNISEYFAVCSKIKINHQKMMDFYEDIKASVMILFTTNDSLVHFEKLIKKYKPKGNQVFDIEIVSVMNA
jgi:predicted nucleic acid-binding protein